MFSVNLNSFRKLYTSHNYWKHGKSAYNVLQSSKECTSLFLLLEKATLNTANTQHSQHSTQPTLNTANTANTQHSQHSTQPTLNTANTQQSQHSTQPILSLHIIILPDTGLSPIKGHRCILEQETLPFSLLRYRKYFM